MTVDVEGSTRLSSNSVCGIVLRDIGYRPVTHLLTDERADAIGAGRHPSRLDPDYPRPTLLSTSCSPAASPARKTHQPITADPR
jgi:hypothetical protein